METTEQLRTNHLGPEQINWLIIHIASGKPIKSWFDENGYSDKERVDFLNHVNRSENKGLIKLFTYARTSQADSLADEILEIVRDVKAGKLEPHAGRVAIDALKWTAARLKPITWGDKQTVDVNHKVGNVSLMDYLLEHATLKPVDQVDAIEAEYQENDPKTLEG